MPWINGTDYAEIVIPPDNEGYAHVWHNFRIENLDKQRWRPGSRSRRTPPGAPFELGNHDFGVIHVSRLMPILDRQKITLTEAEIEIGRLNPSAAAELLWERTRLPWFEAKAFVDESLKS